MEVPDSGIKSTLRLLKSCRKWTDQLAFRWPLTTHFALVIFFSAGTEEQRRKFVKPLASGEKLGAWSLTEPEAGSDAGGTRTVAKKDGDSWVLNGQKTFTTHGTYCDVCVAMAVTDPKKGHDGISAFIIEKDRPGFHRGKKENKLGLRASDTSTVIFEDCRIPASNLLGDEGNGFRDSMKVLDGGRISIAAMALGMAQGAYEAALKYSKERQQFGQPISGISSDTVQARGHGDGNRRCSPLDLPGSMDERQWNENDTGILDGEAICS